MVQLDIAPLNKMIILCVIYLIFTRWGLRLSNYGMVIFGLREEDFQGCRREALAGLRKIEANNKAFGKLLRSSIALNYKKRPSAEKFLRRFNDIFNNDHKYRKRSSGFEVKMSSIEYE